jgi:hypothetical protein
MAWTCADHRGRTAFLPVGGHGDGIDLGGVIRRRAAAWPLSSIKAVIIAIIVAPSVPC